jgi:hypothetical protein
MDLVADVLPHMQRFLQDHCFIVFPSGKQMDLTIYYRDLVGELSVCEAQYFYSVRRAQEALTYGALGAEADLSQAINKVFAAMQMLGADEPPLVKAA